MSVKPTKTSAAGSNGSNQDSKDFGSRILDSEGPPIQANKHSTPETLSDSIETRTQEIGQQIFASLRGKTAGVWNKNFWQTRMMEWTTRSPQVKTQLFRYVDVLPVLVDEAAKQEHLFEYLSPPASAKSWPIFFKMVTAGLRSPLKSIISEVADRQVKEMASQFILGQTPEEVIPKVEKLREKNVAFTLDILGEAVLSEVEAAHYRSLYMRLIQELGQRSRSWSNRSLIDQSPLGDIPKVNLSIKISALDAMPDPIAGEACIARLEERLLPLLREARKHNIFVNFDMEQFAFREMTNELFRRILGRDEFKDLRHIGIVVQAYLKCAEGDVRSWIEFAKNRATPFTIRLVKGAYWDYETVIAAQNSWPSPVFEEKWQSDACYERCAKLLLEAYPHIELAAGSHNVRSLSYCLATAEALGLPKNAMEVQMLYGMSGAYQSVFVERGVRFREYCPVGEMLPGLSYLVRRLLENTANDSFLKQSFLDGRGIQELLKNPAHSKW